MCQLYPKVNKYVISQDEGCRHWAGDAEFGREAEVFDREIVNATECRLGPRQFREWMALLRDFGYPVGLWMRHLRFQ